jgi:transketolase
MKKQFFDFMLRVMRNKDIYMIFIGLGWPRMDELKRKYPDRVINTEASEQTALDIAVGLAYQGKTPFVYTITPFYLRGFETIRTYINHENMNVKLVGVGRDDEYSKSDGFSHDATDIGAILKTQDKIFQYYPDTVKEMQYYIKDMLKHKGPDFISIPR